MKLIQLKMFILMRLVIKMATEFDKEYYQEYKLLGGKKVKNNILKT